MVQLKSPDSSWRSRSAVIVECQPKFASHQSTKVQVTVSALMSMLDTDSSNRVK